MNRFSLPSNIYNSHELIRTASEIGLTLFRKFNNSFIFKTLIPGNNIIISETDNFITISTNQSSNHRRFSISGTTDDKPILNLKSSSDIYLNVVGKTDDDPVLINYCNIYVGVHTHDQNLSVNLNDGIDLIHAIPNTPFELIINAVSKDDIILDTKHFINYLS
jgi:hypothetical protein